MQSLDFLLRRKRIGNRRVAATQSGGHPHFVRQDLHGGSQIERPIIRIRRNECKHLATTHLVVVEARCFVAENERDVAGCGMRNRFDRRLARSQDAANELAMADREADRQHTASHCIVERRVHRGALEDIDGTGGARRRFIVRKRTRRDERKVRQPHGLDCARRRPDISGMTGSAKDDPDAGQQDFGGGRRDGH